MFFNISSNPVYRNFDDNSYQCYSSSSNNLFQKIQKEIIINNKIKEALNRIWKNKHIFEIKSENLSNYNFSNNLIKNFFFLTKENKKVFSIDHQYKENPDRNFEREDNKDESFEFFIEAVLENMYALHPEIIRISEKVKSLLLACGKKWSKNRNESFKTIVETFFDNNEKEND